MVIVEVVLIIVVVGIQIYWVVFVTSDECIWFDKEN